MDIKIKDNTIKIPNEILIQLNIRDNDLLYISVVNSDIVLRKKIKSCIFCNCAVDLVQLSGKCICIDCIERLQKSKPFDILY